MALFTNGEPRIPESSLCLVHILLISLVERFWIVVYKWAGCQRSEVARKDENPP